MTPGPSAEMHGENLDENHYVMLQMLGRCTWLNVTGVVSAVHADT
jgi:hypothetical protein